jgi:hypothetical protein
MIFAPVGLGSSSGSSWWGGSATRFLRREWRGGEGGGALRFANARMASSARKAIMIRNATCISIGLQ